MSVVHHLKTLPVYFDAVERGEKTFEIRKDDRGFQKGDIVRLLRFLGGGDGFTTSDEVRARGGIWDTAQTSSPTHARRVDRRILWILTGGQFGLEPGYVILALGPVEEAQPDPAVWAWREEDRNAIATGLNELRVAAESIYHLTRGTVVDNGDRVGVVIRNALSHVSTATGTLGEIYASPPTATQDPDHAGGEAR